MNASEKAEKIATLKAALAAVESEPSAEELAEALELVRQRAAGDKPPQAEATEAARAAAGVAAVSALTAPAAPPRRLSYQEQIAQAVEAGLASVRAREAKP